MLTMDFPHTGRLCMVYKLWGTQTWPSCPILCRSMIVPPPQSHTGLQSHCSRPIQASSWLPLVHTASCPNMTHLRQQESPFCLWEVRLKLSAIQNNRQHRSSSCGLYPTDSVCFHLPKYWVNSQPQDQTNVKPLPLLLHDKEQWSHRLYLMCMVYLCMTNLSYHTTAHKFTQAWWRVFTLVIPAGLLGAKCAWQWYG